MPSDGQPPKRAELTLRVVSAMVLMPLGLFCVWYGGWALAIAAALAAGAMGFEYARMAKSTVAPILIFAAAGTCLIYPVSTPLAGVFLIGGGILAAMLDRRDGGRFSSFFGCLYAGGLALSLLALRNQPDVGRALAMGVMFLTWASDTSAYFVGRAVGGPLLAPRDSPNKTWSGATGAVVGAAVVAVIYAMLINGPKFDWAIVGMFVSVTAQFGDLFESQIKRQHNVKDTSGLLPGHGGVMDRLDGFGTAAVGAVLVLYWMPDLGRQLAGVA